MIKGKVNITQDGKDIYSFSSLGLEQPTLTVEEVELNRRNPKTGKVDKAYVAGRHEWQPMTWRVNQKAHMELVKLTEKLYETKEQYQCELLIPHMEREWELENIFFIDESDDYTENLTVYYDHAKIRLTNKHKHLTK